MIPSLDHSTGDTAGPIKSNLLGVCGLIELELQIRTVPNSD